jgi:hypothetical protein
MLRIQIASVSCAILAIASAVAADELACNKAFTAAVTAAAMDGTSAGCGPTNAFQRCILALNLGEPLTSDALKDVSGHIARCEPSGESAQIQTKQGGIEITVDSRRSVKFNKRSAQSIDIWELSDKVEEIGKMGDAFEARFQDAKSTVNQISIAAIDKCNAVGPALTESLAESLKDVDDTLNTKAAELNALATKIQSDTEEEISKIKKDIDDTVTSAVTDLTSIAAATTVCAAKGQQVDQKNGNCIDHPTIKLKVVPDKSDLPTCNKAIQGQVSLTSRRGLLRCITGKWVAAIASPLGSELNPLKDCKEAQTEFGNKGSARVWVIDSKSSTGKLETFCNLVTGKPGADGKTKESPGRSCADIKKGGGNTNGLYWINPDNKGEAFQVYCEQETDGGGWMLMQHTRWGRGSNPCGLSSNYRQHINAWVEKGIGNIAAWHSTKSPLNDNKCYFMPFKNWRRITGTQDSGGVISEMSLVSERGFGQKITMDNFYLSSGSKPWGLRMSNYQEIKAKMCNNQDNCFANQNIGFSSYANDADIYGTHCARNYNNQAWWYANCYHHNQFKQGMSDGQFSGCQGSSMNKHGNCYVENWSWFTR